MKTTISLIIIAAAALSTTAKPKPSPTPTAIPASVEVRTSPPPSSVTAMADSNLQTALTSMMELINNGGNGFTAEQIQGALGAGKVERIRAADKAYNGK